MTQPYNPALHRFALFVASCTLLLLVAGALVTSNDAALSVPDWPLSYGTVTPPMVGGIIYEHSHRVIAATVGLLTILLAAWLWLKEERSSVRWLGVAALGAVIAQGVLGGMTVLFTLRYGFPVEHACLAQLFFCATITLALFTSRWWQSDLPRVEGSGSPSIHLLAGLTVAATFFQLILGGAAWWSRLSTANAPQPMPVMVTLTVMHTVFGALTLAGALLVVLVCSRLVERGREAALARHPQGAALS